MNSRLKSEELFGAQERRTIKHAQDHKLRVIFQDDLTR